MKSRMFLPAVALIAAGASLAGCAAQGMPRAASEGENLASCERVTGSRIRASRRTHCEPVGYPYRNFSAEELQATGKIDLVEALRQLDPAFQ